MERKRLHAGKCETDYNVFKNAINYVERISSVLEPTLYTVTCIPNKCNTPEIKIGNKIGMKFITNLDKSRSFAYRKAIFESGIRASVINEAYGCNGEMIETYRAFYVSTEINDLTNFWDTLDRIEKESNLDKK